MTFDGNAQTYMAASMTVNFNGEGGDDTAVIYGSGANQSVVLKPDTGNISGPGYSLNVLAASITVNAGGGSGQAHLLRPVAEERFHGRPVIGNDERILHYGRDRATANRATGFQQVAANGTRST